MIVRLTSKWLYLQAVLFLALSLSFIVGSGARHCDPSGCTLAIGSWHLHDALWHIALAKLGFTSWPLSQPLMSGETLSGYNFLLDIVLAGLIKLGISPFLAFFQLLPVAAGLLYAWTVLTFVGRQTQETLKANLLAFFLFFGNSMSYLATLYADHTFTYATLKGFPVVTSIQPASMFLNLQFAFSLSAILWILMIMQRQVSKIRIICLGLLFMLLFGLKFYGGVVMAVLATGLWIAEIVKAKRIPQGVVGQFLSMIIGSGLGLLIFYGVGNGAKLPFSFAPFALTHLMIDDVLLFYNHSLTLARYYLYEHNSGFSPRLILIEAGSILLFLLLNFGARLVSVWYVIRSLWHKSLSPRYGVIAIVIVLTTLVPILFVQVGGWYNTMQFLYYGVWLSGIITAELLYGWIKSGKQFLIIAAFAVILLTLPNNLEQIRYAFAPQVVVSHEELTALQILKEQEPGVVHVSESEHKNALVPVFAEKYPYYLDTDQLMVTHAPYQARLAFIRKYAGGSIGNIPADYFYIYKQDEGSGDALRALDSPANYARLYDGEMVAVFKRISPYIQVE